MYRIEQVLIPVDFSSFSRTALAFAGRLASPLGGEGAPRMQLVHAVPPFSPYLRRVLFPYAALGEDDREFEAEILEAAQQELARYFEIDGKLRKRFIDEPLVEFGPPRGQVERWVSRFDVDLVALGAFGESGAYTGGLGSTARRLLQVSTKPVALLRDYEARPRIRRILVGLDLGMQTAEVLRVALGIAIQQSAHLELLHVIPSPFVYDTNQLLERELHFKPNEVEKKIRPRLDAHFERALQSLKIPFAFKEEVEKRTGNLVIRSGSPASELAAMAYDGEFDLVIVGANNRQSSASRSLGRVASEALRQVPTHMIVVPPRREVTPLVELDE